MTNKIQVQVLVSANIHKIWEYWNNPEKIKAWAFASDDWECPYAENDLRDGGKFVTRMSTKDQSFGFDFTGTYADIKEFAKISYTMDKGANETKARKCEVIFEDLGNGKVKITETFDPENENSEELQRNGWQGILNNFKKLVEK
ncbi:MAG TPA: SRPBCC domain-containing protein [Candidatus Nanoarchaeia archaeon]|nr:SRPBCC domain-containing protein [Candidatus Nanoarchaeia archaeon]